MTADARQEIVACPGGIRARFRWVGTGQGDAALALGETGGALYDFGPGSPRPSSAPAGPTRESRARADTFAVEAVDGLWTTRTGFADYVDGPR